MVKNYVQYGCGTLVNNKWNNYDASPTLFIQKIPLLGKIARKWLNCVFPDTVFYGNIVRGLPIPDNSVDGVFCSHVLEHLLIEDFYVALKNTFKILKPNGVFRCILPDLYTYAREYTNTITAQKLHYDPSRDTASIRFMEKLNMASLKKRNNVKSLLSLLFGYTGHRWMWDKYSLTKVLTDQGFIDIEPFVQNKCEDEMFLQLEEDWQFTEAIALQCKKPRSDLACPVQI